MVADYRPIRVKISRSRSGSRSASDAHRPSAAAYPGRSAQRACMGLDSSPRRARSRRLAGDQDGFVEREPQLVAVRPRLEEGLQRRRSVRQHGAQPLDRRRVAAQPLGPGLELHVLGQALLVHDLEAGVAQHLAPFGHAEAAAVAGVADLLEGVVGQRRVAQLGAGEARRRTRRRARCCRPARMCRRPSARATPRRRRSGRPENDAGRCGR